MKAKREGIGVAELKRQLASGACAPIYVLLGEESYLRETALAAIRRVVLGAEDQETGFNYDLLYGDETDALEVLNRCDTFPAFADRRLVVIRNVGALPARDRAVVVLRYWEDQSVDAVAEVLGISPAAVKTRSLRALARLREVLADSRAELLVEDRA